MKKSTSVELEPARRRDAAATRAAILASARKLFARVGYDGAGVREIASGAGVTAMLVNRYFGSKEELFAEVVAQTMESPRILTEEILNSATPGADMAAALVDLTGPGETPLDGFLIMLRSAPSHGVATIGGAQVQKRHQKAMTAALSGAHAPERAALILSIVAGVQVMRQMVALPALAKADRATLIKILWPVFQMIIDGAPANKKRA